MEKEVSDASSFWLSAAVDTKTCYALSTKQNRFRIKSTSLAKNPSKLFDFLNPARNTLLR